MKTKLSGNSKHWHTLSGVQAALQSRRLFEGMLAACRKLATLSAKQPVRPGGRVLKLTAAALHFLPRTMPLPAKCVLHL